MYFRREIAADTLVSVARALKGRIETLDPAARDQIHKLIKQYGWEIFRADAANSVLRIVDCLDALSRLGAILPAEARQALAAGQIPAPQPFDIYRIEPSQKATVLAALVGVHDPRQFADAETLAWQISQLVSENLDRLTPAELAAWRTLDEAFKRDRQAEPYLRGVERLLAGRVVTIREMLDAGKSWNPNRDLGRPRPPVAEAGERGGSSGPTLVTRYANVFFPAVVLKSQASVPLVVHVAELVAGGVVALAEGDAKMTLQVGDMTLILSHDGFKLERAAGGRKVDGLPTARTIEVRGEGDCDPVVYFLTPQTTGRKRLGLDFYQFERNIATLRFESEIVEEMQPAKSMENVHAAPIAMVSPAGGQDAPVPDLELRVSLSSDLRTLSFRLHAPKTGDYRHKEVGSKTLLTDPRAYIQPKLDELSGLARVEAAERTPEAHARTLAALDRLGNNLFDELFPDELKREYVTVISQKYRGCSLLISSDEPWIPWEMVKPFVGRLDGRLLNPPIDDPFFCESFLVARWLPGYGAPDQVVLRQGLLVAPPDNLAAVAQETGYFKKLNDENWLIRMAGPVGALGEVSVRFERGETQLFHFACHGNFDATNADESMLQLADGFLQPSYIVGRVAYGVEIARPLVFLNACHGGEIGFSLTKLGGWAEKFIGSGASAFVGALWEINDKLASDFALEFYNRLWGLAGCPKQTLGQAFYDARRVIRAKDPANPTWLAYVLYGDPNSEVRLGDSNTTRGSRL